MLSSSQAKLKYKKPVCRWCWKHFGGPSIYCWVQGDLVQETFEIQSHLHWGNNLQPSAEKKSKLSWCFWVRGKCNWSDVPHASPPPAENNTASKFSGNMKISTAAWAELSYAVLFTFEGNCWLLSILPHVRQNNPLSFYSIKLFNIPSFLCDSEGNCFLEPTSPAGGWKMPAPGLD